MATRSTRTPSAFTAYVLHHYDWSESSVILDLFTREQGRLAVVAKGAKRPYSQLRSVLLPFQRLQVSIARPPRAAAGHESAGEVQTLRHAEWAGGPPMPSGAALFSGFYLNELLMKLLARQDPHPAVFDAYAGSLPMLADRNEGVVQAALRAFELTLLQRLGVLPDLSVVTSTQALVSEGQRYALHGDAGVVAAPSGDADVSGRTLIDVQAALQHGGLAPLQQICAAALPELRAALRGLLLYHLGSPTLRTRRVMLEVQALQQTLGRQTTEVNP